MKSRGIHTWSHDSSTQILSFANHSCEENKTNRSYKYRNGIGDGTGDAVSSTSSKKVKKKNLIPDNGRQKKKEPALHIVMLDHARTYFFFKL